MIKSAILKLTLASVIMFPVGKASGIALAQSKALKSSLATHDKDAWNCMCVIDCSGKTQGAACIKALEDLIQQGKGLQLAGAVNGFIGLNTGSIIATSLALGQDPMEITEAIDQLSAKLITPKEVACCLGCLGKTTKLAGYFVDGSDFSTENDGIINNYDAIKLDRKAKALISNVTAGSEWDLKTGLTILSTSNSKDFSEQVLVAITESDAAAKANVAKVAFSTILDAAKMATHTAITVGGEKINQSAAQKALDIMTKIDDVSSKVEKVSANTLFKQNLVMNLAEPTPEKPLFLLGFKAVTSGGEALRTFYDQEIEDNSIKATYTVEIPANYYPSKDEPFDLIMENIKSSIDTCMQSKRLDSAKSTEIIAEFLASRKVPEIENSVMESDLEEVDLA